MHGIEPWLEFCMGPIQIPTQKRVKNLDPFLIYYHYLFQFRSSKYYGTHFHLQGPHWNQPKSIRRYLKIEKGVSLLDKGGEMIRLWLKDYTLIKKQSVLRPWLRPEGPFPLPQQLCLYHVPHTPLLGRSPHMPTCFDLHFMVGNHLG